MNPRSKVLFRPGLAFVLLIVLLAVLCLAGGASRGDAAGQAVVRTTAWLALIVTILFGRRSNISFVRPPWIFLLVAIAIAILQLVPLPAGLWQALPGRAFVGEIAGGRAGEWRSLSLVPGATFNALSALVVPFAVLILMAGLSKDEKARLPGIVLIFVMASMLVGLLQFTGAEIDNPLVNDTPGVVSGTFANRNHFALFLALGCLLVPAWMFREGRRLHWRGPAGLGMLLLLALMILASGSRAGMALGLLAIFIAGLMSRRGLRREFRHAPRWVLPAVIGAVIALLASFVLVSVAADRAVSVQRSLAIDVEQDMRSRALPTVLDMTRAVFPAGSGLGGFDPMFRIHEPDDLLKPTYFNHAHNDFVEIVLDSGLPGLLTLLAALLWWGWASAKAWRGVDRRSGGLAMLGSSILLLIMGASVFDYPARTPMIMAMIVLAAAWLSDPSDGTMGAALPESDQHL